MRLSRRAVLATPLLAAATRPPLAAVPIDRLNLHWWAGRHAEKLAELRAGRVDLLFLGDSITQNWERHGPPAWADFQPIWQRLYGHRHAVNLGFAGDATSHLLWRIENGELDGITPKAAVILIGANNLGRLHWSAADSVIGIDSVVATTRRKLPRTSLLLLGILPSQRTAWASETTLTINRALATKYATGTVPGVTYRDVGPVFQRSGAFDRTAFYDQLMTPPENPLHPTAQAQERMALAIEPVLAGMLGER